MLKCPASLGMTNNFLNISAKGSLNARYIHKVRPDPLRNRIVQIIPHKLEEMKRMRDKYKNEVLGQYTVDQIYAGMRGIVGMTYETSLLDPNEGIRFRGFTIDDVRDKLPKLNSKEPLPEGIFWLLLTGEIPTKYELEYVRSEWARRSTVPKQVIQIINSFGQNIHPMAQLSAAVTVLSYKSKFGKEYNSGKLAKSDYWIHTYEDSMDLIAKLPTIAALIFRNIYYDGYIPPYDSNIDWTGNFVKMMGFSEEAFADFMRLYMVIHCDHEGGNVSAHANKLVGSSLSDSYLSFAAGLNGLAGPLHGRANQQVIEWLDEMSDVVSDYPTEAEVTDYCKKALLKGVIPGYGHAVLRKTDPRFTVQLDFADKNIMEENKNLRMIKVLFKILPQLLAELGKVKNPYPNVDAISGSILDYYRLRERNFYTVPFGLSRCIGVSASLIWDRIFGLPLERPKSITTEALFKKFGQN